MSSSTPDLNSEDAMTAVSTDGGPRRRWTQERIGEAVLLASVTAFFGYMLYDSMSWPSDAALLPRMALGLGAPFLAFRWFKVLWGGQEGPLSQIIDTGFRSSGDAREDRKRFLQVSGLIVFLILGIWLVGVEIAIPLGVVIYLYFFAGVGLFKSLLVGVGLLAGIIGLYDEVINAPWPDSLLWRLFGA